MSTPNEQERRDALCEAMVGFADRVEQDKDLFVSEGDRADLLYDLKRLVGLIRARKANPEPPSPDRRITSLVNGLEALARELGSLCAPADTFAALVAQRCTDDDARDYWRENAQPLWGYVRYHTIVPDQLRDRGVLLWTSPDLEIERRIFLVDERRPTASDLDGWLVLHRENTRRCQLCDTPIYHHRPETYLDYPYGDNQRARIHTQCEQAWSRVVEIASKYATFEEAAAADEAAGIVPAGLVSRADEEAARAGGEEVNSTETQVRDAPEAPLKYPGVESDWTGEAPAPSSADHRGADGGWTGEGPSNARPRRRRA